MVGPLISRVGVGGSSLKWDLISEKLVLKIVCFSREEESATTGFTTVNQKLICQGSWLKGKFHTEMAWFDR